jgi:hypothetical protein
MRTSRHCNRLPAARRPATAYFTVPSFIDTALVAPRSGLSPTAAVKRMADDFRQGAHREGGITGDDLEALGWTAGQVKTHGADARALAQQLAGASL